MESPVSAFAIYKTTNPQKTRLSIIKKKKKPKKQVNNKKPWDISDSTIKQGMEKIKKKQKNSKHLNNTVGKRKDKKGKGSKNYVTKKIMNGNIAPNKNIVSVQPERKNKISNKPENTTKVLAQPENNKVNIHVVEEIPDLIPARYEAGEDSCSCSSDGSVTYTPVQTDSSEEGLKAFKWLVAPFDPDEFLNHVWEKKPLHIARNKSSYYKELITTPLIDNMLRKENIQFTKNIDVTSYVNNVRETHNPEGRAYPHLVWDYYLNGCSIRLLNPQTYLPKLHLMNATLQEFFNSFVGANAYLTPPDSQGFAPHYDDIEAFILQTEGQKQWRVYKPLSKEEVLPRVSSKNFEQEEIGEPILEITLKAGDMLYFPRGYIHQGVTIEGEHSLHVTISMYQKHSWADLFEKLIPAALQIAVHETVDLRQGLPFDIYDHFGLVHSDAENPRRNQIKEFVNNLFDKIKDHLPIDEAVDQMNKNYQHDALPPVLDDMEKAVTVHGDTDVMIEDGKVVNRVEIELDTRIRLLRKNILRMVSEDKIRLYYYAENSLEYHGNELSFIEIEEELAPAIETLILTYPEYVSVENLDLQNDSDKIEIADALWSRGLIMTEYPLDSLSDGE